MTVHPHDTDRILGVLGDAIEKLREVHYGYSRTGAQEVANDLALLHGAVSAERDKHAAEVDDLSKTTWHGWSAGGVSGEFTGRGSVSTQEDTTKRAFLRLVKHEEISDEVLRGEHREDN